MRFVLFVVIILLSVVSAYPVVVELNDGSLLVGKVEKADEDRIYISQGDILLNIDTAVAHSFYTEEVEINYAELKLLKYDEFDASRFGKEIVIDRNYKENVEVMDFINSHKYKDNDLDYKNFIQLDSGEKIYGEVVVKQPFLSSKYFLLDNEREIPYNDVYSYKNDEGYFQAIPDPFSSKTFARRIRKGRIDLFSKEATYYHAGTFNTFSTPGGDFSTFSPGYVTTSRFDYFRKGNSELKRANYENLEPALSDNPQSMEYLRQYKNLNTMQWITAGATIGFIIAGLSQLDNEEGLSSSGKTFLVLGGISGMMAWIPHLGKPDKLEKAIEEYNK